MNSRSGVCHGELNVFRLDGPDARRPFSRRRYSPAFVRSVDVQDAIERTVAEPPEPRPHRSGSPDAGSIERYHLEFAARRWRPCAGSWRFAPVGFRDSGPRLRIPDPESLVPMEELLLRHALGEDPARYEREATASGVMMIPIPRRGVLRRVEGIDEARQVTSVDDVRITAKTDQALVPSRRRATWLLCARAATPAAVARALREAHARLRSQSNEDASDHAGQKRTSAPWLIRGGHSHRRLPLEQTGECFCKSFRRGLPESLVTGR